MPRITRRRSARTPSWEGAKVPLGAADFNRPNGHATLCIRRHGKERHGDCDSAGRLHRRRVGSGRRRGDRGHEPGHRRAARNGGRIVAGPGRRGGRRRPPRPSATWRRVSLLERVELCRAAFDRSAWSAPRRSREMITREVGKTIRESREEMVEYTADHFRRASEDVLRYARQGAPVDAGAFERQADRRRPGADRRRRGRHSVELPGRHRRDPDRLRPRGRLHGRLEAVRARAALREHVRRGHPRRRLPGRDV